MKLGLYIFAALALMGIVAGVTYTINSNHYIVDILGINFNLPIAGWVVLPMFLLFLFTLLHMLIYGLKSYFMLKRWQKDANTLEDALYWSLVNEPKEQKYATVTLGNSALLLSKASLNVSGNMTGTIEGLSPRLTRVLSMIQKINSGEYVDLKEEKMSKVFHVSNPILAQNTLNRLSVDEKFSEEVLRSASEYPQEVLTKALDIFSSKEGFEKARRYTKVFDVQHFLEMLQRVDAQHMLEMTPAVLSEFAEVLPLRCEDYVKMAIVTKKYFKPDENLTLFRGLQSKNEDAQNAYLYLLFEYELLDQVGVFLDEQGEDEFIKFRVLYALKKEHHKYKLEDIIDMRAVCK